jgi:hypothetical protein
MTMHSPGARSRAADTSGTEIPTLLAYLLLAVGFFAGGLSGIWIVGNHAAEMPSATNLLAWWPYLVWFCAAVLLPLLLGLFLIERARAISRWQAILHQLNSLEAPPSEKLAFLGTLARHIYGDFPAGHATAQAVGYDATAREIAAGGWVLEQLAQGRTVLAVPAGSEEIQEALRRADVTVHELRAHAESPPSG